MNPKPWEVTDDDLAQGNVPIVSAKDDDADDVGKDMLVDGDDEFEELDDPWSDGPPISVPAVTPARPIGARSAAQKSTTPAKPIPQAEPAPEEAEPAPEEVALPVKESAPAVEVYSAKAQESEPDTASVQEPVEHLSVADTIEPTYEPDRLEQAPKATQPPVEQPDLAANFDDADDFDDFWDDPVAPDSGASTSGYDLGPSPAGAPMPTQPTVPVLGVGAPAAGSSVADGAEPDDEDPDDSITVTLRRNREAQKVTPSREYRTSTESRRPVRPSERRHKMDAAPVKQGPMARMKKLVGAGQDGSEAHETSARRATIRPLNVVVLGKKGGVGKTAMTALLGMVFASVRNDRVLAVDASPTGGNLSARCPKEGKGTVVSLLDQLEYVTAYANVREHTSKGATGLEVLGADVHRPQRPITGNDYRALMDELRGHYQLILSDTAGDITTATSDGSNEMVDALLDEADLLVLAAEGVDGANAAVWLVNWLKMRLRNTDDEHLERLLDDLIVVVTSRSEKSNAKPEKIAKYFSEEVARRVVTVPFDRAVEGGLEIDYEAISSRTRKAILELADAVTGSDAFTGR